MAHQKHSTSPFQAFKHSNPTKPYMRFASKPRPLASQTMPDLGLFHRSEPDCDAHSDKSKQYFSCLPETFDWDMAGPIPSPVNTAASPSFSGSPAATFPCLAKFSSKYEKEIEELEYARSEDDRSATCAPTAAGDDNSMCEDEDEEDDDDDNSTIADQYLRQPSVNASLLFRPYSPDSEELPILFFDNTVLLSDSVKTSVLAFTHTLCHYRLQLNLWEKEPSASPAVFRASALIDQCLLRVSYILEPVWERCVKRLMNFEKEFLRLDQILADPKYGLSHNVEDPTAFDELCQLGDQSSRIGGALSDLSQSLTDLYEWTDGYLTPALAELTTSQEDPLNSNNIPQEDQRNFQVSALLDAHSYLCVSLDRTSDNIKLCHVGFETLTDACQRFPNLVIQDHVSLKNDRSKFRIWLKESHRALIPIREALATLASNCDTNIPS